MEKAAEMEEGTYPNHRTKRIAEDEEGEPKEGFYRRHMELFLNTLEACRVDCGADVDGSGEEAYLKCDEELSGSGPIAWVMRVVGGPGDEEVVAAFLLVNRSRIQLVYSRGTLFLCI